MKEQKELRGYYLEVRETMSEEQVKKASAKIAENLLSMVQVRSSEWIYLYYQLGNEVEMTEVIQELWKLGKKTAFPKVSGDDIVFYEVTSLELLQEGNFHIMEPDEDLCRRTDVVAPVVLVPGVVFDGNGNRIGHGKGFYDRFLEKHPKAYKIGVAYECQMAEEIEPTPTDVQMDCMVTEAGIYQSRYRSKKSRK